MKQSEHSECVGEDLSEVSADGSVWPVSAPIAVVVGSLGKSSNIPGESKSEIAEAAGCRRFRGRNIAGQGIGVSGSMAGEEEEMSYQHTIRRLQPYWLTVSSSIIPASMSFATPSHATACTSAASWFSIYLTSSITLSAFQHDERVQLILDTAHWHSLRDQSLDVLHHEEVKDNLHDLDFELIICGVELLDE